MMVVRSSCLGTRNPISLSGATDSVSVNHLSNSPSFHVTFVLQVRTKMRSPTRLPYTSSFIDHCELCEVPIKRR
jgi:hypothetical protein